VDTHVTYAAYLVLSPDRMGRQLRERRDHRAVRSRMGRRVWARRRGLPPSRGV